MATVRITEAELRGNIDAVLAQVRQGVEVEVVRDYQPLARILPPATIGLKASQILATLEAIGADTVVDEEFARDVEAGIQENNQPWIPPSWE